MLDLLLVSIAHRKRLLRLVPLEGGYAIRQSSPGEIAPGKVQLLLEGTIPVPSPLMMVTDLTMTGLGPMFVTLHSPPPTPRPVQITAAMAACLRSRIDLGLHRRVHLSP